MKFWQRPEGISIKDVIRYRMDLFMSWSPIAKFVFIFIIYFAFAFLFTALSLLFIDGPQDATLFDTFWWALNRVTDPGTMAPDQSTPARLIAMVAAIVGLMVVAVLIGLVSTALEQRLEALQKGHSPVIDENHTIVIGYNEKLFPILSELREANDNQTDSCVVVLAEEDKVVVEDAIKERLGSLRPMRVVVRHGLADSPEDLKKIGAGRAKSVIVLADDKDDKLDTNRSNTEMSAIKTVLALKQVPGCLTQNHAVIELIDTSRLKVLDRLAGSGVEVVAMRDTLSRLMVQTALQSGLAQVYSNLLTYEGSEFYFHSFPGLSGRTFSDCQKWVLNAVVVGLRKANSDGTYKVYVNPPNDMLVESKDELLVLAEDDDTFSLSQTPIEFPSGSVPTYKGANTRVAENVLICGYRSDFERVVSEFNEYMAEGSELHLMPGDRKRMTDMLPDEGFVHNLDHVSVKYIKGEPTDPEDLERVLNARSYDAILVVADDTKTPKDSDANTIITLLLIRSHYDLLKEERPRIITEILDQRATQLVSDNSTSDFVISTQIISMLLTQVSERKELNDVFKDLFDPDGSEIYLKDAKLYANPGETLHWATIQKNATSRDEVALGCFREGFTPLLNPPPQHPVQLLEGDKIIVLAEDEGEIAVVRDSIKKVA